MALEVVAVGGGGLLGLTSSLLPFICLSYCGSDLLLNLFVLMNSEHIFVRRGEGGGGGGGKR